MTATRFSDRELDDLKARRPPCEVATDWVKLRRKRGGRKGFTHVGPCPLCSGASPKKSDARFEAGPDSFACAACGKGGDIIALWGLRHGLDPKRDFVAIVEQLGGVREVVETPTTATRAGRAAHARGLPRSPVPDVYAAPAALRSAWCAGWDKAERRARANAMYRERERKRLHDKFWDPAAPWQGTPVETYLRLRGLKVPPHAKLRYAPNIPYFKTGDEVEPVVLHRGPAMLAAIRDAAGIFRGLHITWLDPSLCDPSRTMLDDGSRTKGKAVIIDPDSGEILKAKKSRGSKQGGYIDLGGVPHVPPRDLAGERPIAFTRQFSGEGIESTLAVYTAMVTAGRDVRGIAWRCGIDLGNLCGAAEDSERHPTLKDAAGRARRVPGRSPDMTSPAMPVIAGAVELVQLGDSDSDAFTTQCAMERGERRRGREGLGVRTIWPPNGMDFNDWILSAAQATGLKA